MSILDELNLTEDETKLLETKKPSNLHFNRPASTNLTYALYAEKQWGKNFSSMAIIKNKLNLIGGIKRFIEILDGYEIVEFEGSNSKISIIKDMTGDDLIDLSSVLKNEIDYITLSIDNFEKYYKLFKENKLKLSKDKKFITGNKPFKVIIRGAENFDLFDQTQIYKAKSVFKKIANKIEKDIDEHDLNTVVNVGNSQGIDGCTITIFTDNMKHLNFIKLMGIHEYTIMVPHNFIIRSDQEFQDTIGIF